MLVLGSTNQVTHPTMHDASIRSNPNGTSAASYKSILKVKLMKIFKEDIHRGKT
jgi:hypothetical protein